MDFPDSPNPAAALEAVAALPLAERPEALMQLADELERRLDSTASPGGGPLEQPPGRP